MIAKPRILVVDDEPVVRESLRDWFTNDGFPVDMAADAHEALQKLQESSWDILLTDVKMPGMDGLELQQKVKQIDPDITVIIMTAYASVDSAMQAIKEGAYDYVTKPLDPDDLQQIIDRASEHRRLLSENLDLRQRIGVVSGEADDVIGESRELQDTIERTAAQQQGEEVLPGDLPLGPPEDVRPPRELTLAEVEKQHIQNVLAKVSGDVSKAAELLKIDQTTLSDRMRKYGLAAALHE